MSLSKAAACSRCPMKAGEACKTVAACLPCGYGFVLLTGVGSVALNMYFASRVMKARKEYGVEYPTMYSATEQKFNCIQRGHQNYLEQQPQFLFLLLAGGLGCPRAATIGGCVYLAGRLLYFHGYATGDPSKRMRGAVGYFGFFTLVFATVALAVANIKLCCKVTPALK